MMSKNIMKKNISLSQRIKNAAASQEVENVKARHTYQSVSRSAQPSATALVLKGKFTRVGRFRISIVAMLYDGANGHEVAYFRQTRADLQLFLAVPLFTLLRGAAGVLGVGARVIEMLASRPLGSFRFCN
ncbi:MAG: hypothetical protein HGA22_12830 [Clostridiales bacterium]|nr:hypothetical protein [Clostridiales bacterium]